MAINMSSINASYLSNINVSNMNIFQFFEASRPLVIFTLTIVVYGIFIFKFYRFLAKRDIFKLDHDYYSDYRGGKKHFYRVLFYSLENLLLTPILVFFWFAVLATLLVVLSNNPPETIFLASAAIVGAIRITSYYSENLSQDLAKMVPFALLGVFLVDISFFSIQEIIDKVSLVPVMFDQLLYYLLFLVCIEYLFRIFHGFGLAAKRSKYINIQD